MAAGLPPDQRPIGFLPEPRRRRCVRLRSKTLFRKKGLIFFMDNSRVQACVLFLLAAVSIGANSAAAQGKPLTARDVIARIQAHAEFLAEGDGGHVQGGQSGRGGQAWR